MSFNFLNYIFSKVGKSFKVGTYTRKGTNFSGKICVFHRGGGTKKAYRIIDFYRRVNTFGYVCAIKKDPNRTAFIGLILYDNGYYANIILAENANLGSKIFSGDTNINDNSKGSSCKIQNISTFSVLNNIEMRPFVGASLARAAGVGAVLISSHEKNAFLKMRSGWVIKISNKCIASKGYVSNILHNTKVYGKAGIRRNLGWRPTVRGVAMNPCDHPHGGGNGKSSPPTAPLSPWNKITKWTHSKNKKADKLKRRLFKKLR